VPLKAGIMGQSQSATTTANVVPVRVTYYLDGTIQFGDQAKKCVKKLTCMGVGCCAVGLWCSQSAAGAAPRAEWCTAQMEGCSTGGRELLFTMVGLLHHYPFSSIWTDVDI